MFIETIVSPGISTHRAGPSAYSTESPWRLICVRSVTPARKPSRVSSQIPRETVPCGESVFFRTKPAMQYDGAAFKWPASAA